jgi:hypothetical protein
VVKFKRSPAHKRGTRNSFYDTAIPEGYEDQQLDLDEFLFNGSKRPDPKDPAVSKAESPSKHRFFTRSEKLFFAKYFEDHIRKKRKIAAYTLQQFITRSLIPIAPKFVLAITERDGSYKKIFDYVKYVTSHGRIDLIIEFDNLKFVQKFESVEDKLKFILLNQCDNIDVY